MHTKPPSQSPGLGQRAHTSPCPLPYTARAHALTHFPRRLLAFDPLEAAASLTTRVPG